MREIKFRGWDNLDNKMCMPKQIRNGVMTKAPEDYEGYCITLMQFTGLLDKNSKEIYEGDVFVRDVLMHKDGDTRGTQGTYWIPCKCVVDFNNDDGRFCGKYKFKKLNMKSNYINVDSFTNRSGIVLLEKGLEVIGNIYENPELVSEIE